MTSRLSLIRWLTACRRGRLLFLFCLGFGCAQAMAGAVPIDPFLARAFARVPPPSVLWMTPTIKERAAAAAGFAPEGTRLRYWRDGARTAWVLERIGKEAPITFGVIVERDAIVALEVITYRESRGHEIRAPRWLAQFSGARAKSQGFDRDIDNITGATLSARAARDVARLALALHGQVMATGEAP